MDHRDPSESMYPCRRRLRRLLNTPSSGRPVCSCSIVVVKPSAVASCVKSWTSARGNARAPCQAPAAGTPTSASSACAAATRRSSMLSLLLRGFERHRRFGCLPRLTQPYSGGVDVVIHGGLEVLVTRPDLETFGRPAIVSQDRQRRMPYYVRRERQPGAFLQPSEDRIQALVAQWSPAPRAVADEEHMVGFHRLGVRLAHVRKQIVHQLLGHVQGSFRS